MGLFAKAAGAKSTQTGEFGKPGHYFVIIENVKFGTQSADGKEFMAFETRYLHVLDPAIWPGDPKSVPLGKGGQALLNVPGSEPKVGEPCSFVFKDGVLGNENRLKRIILKALDMNDDDWKRACPTEEAGVNNMKQMCDPAMQPLRNTVIEVKAGETSTRAKEKIVGSNPLRRVYAEELRQLWGAGKLAAAAQEFLGKEDRLAKMLDQEARERAARGLPPLVVATQPTTAAAVK